MACVIISSYLAFARHSIYASVTTTACEIANPYLQLKAIVVAAVGIVLPGHAGVDVFWPVCFAPFSSL
jgi:hypothetical protein